MTTPAQAPAPDTLRRARAFWEQSQADLKEARRRRRARSYLDSAFLSCQAALNALTCVCYLNGTVRAPSFSTLQLLALSAEADPRFKGLGEVCDLLETLQHRNPYDPERDAAEEKGLAVRCLEGAEQVVKVVRGYLKDNRERFGSM